MNKYRISEIFPAIEGESLRSGQLVTFLRLFGCNLGEMGNKKGCWSQCDSCFSYCGMDYKIMDIPTIIKELKEIGNNKISVSGGEPLYHDNIFELLKALSKEGFEITVETNGSIEISNAMRKLKNIRFIIDYKGPTSGFEDEMKISNFLMARPYDGVKFVCGSKEDLEKMKEMLNYTSAQCFVSPLFGSIDPKDIAEFIIENKLEKVRLQLQIHKILYDPEARGV